MLPWLEGSAMVASSPRGNAAKCAHRSRDSDRAAARKTPECCRTPGWDAHTGQWDAGWDNDSPRGSRHAHDVEEGPDEKAQESGQENHGCSLIAIAGRVVRACGYQYLG